MEVPQEIYQDFRNHLYFTMKYLGLGEPTPLQYAIAEEVQSGQKDMQLQAGRGAGKSTIVASYASWLLLNNPDTTIMVLSATQDRAIKFIAQVRQILTLVPYMAHLLPQEFDKDNAFGFNVGCRSKVGQDMSCYAKGITGQITGSHADYVLCDDVEIEKNSDSPQSRNKLVDKLAELEQIRNPVSWGRIVMLGTYQSTDSIYLRLPYPIVKFPAVIPNPDSESEMQNVHPYILELEGEPGESVDPTRFPQHVLDERLAKIGPRQFNLHYRLDPTLSDTAKYPLKLEDLIVMDCNPQLFPEKVVWGRGQPLKISQYGIHGDFIYGPMWKADTMTSYRETLLFVDPSGRGGDETAVCVASFINGYIVIHVLTGLSGGYDDATMAKIAKLAMQYDVNAIRVESNYGDGMFCSLLRPVVSRVAGRIAVEEFKVTGNKERRIIDTLEPIMSQHRLVFDTSAINDKETQTQITRMQDKRGALKHDDRIDILASAVKTWSEELVITPDLIIERNKQKEHQETVKQWLSNDRIYGLLPDTASGALRNNITQPKKSRSILDNYHRR